MPATAFDNLISQFVEHTTPATDTTIGGIELTGDLGGTATAPTVHGITTIYTPSSIGQWYSNPAALGFSTFDRGLNNLCAHPWYSGPDGITIDQFDHEVSTAGAAGAVMRAGIWTIIDQYHPFRFANGTKWATLIADLGTVDCTTTGRKIITPATAITIPAYTWFAVGGVEQVAVSTAHAATFVGGPGPFGQASATSSYNSNGGMSIVMGSVTGALTDFTPSSGNYSADDGVGIHRSA